MTDGQQSRRAAFISDIHGNYAALTAVLAEIDALAIAEIFCVGDVAGYYSEVNECCDELRARQIPTVLGNHDWYLGGNGHCQRSKSVNDCLAYQRTVISDANLVWLRSLPVAFDCDSFRMVHGGWEDPVDEYLDPSAEYFAHLPGSHFVSGHTHVQLACQFPQQSYCNPGSVGQPRDGDPHAAFTELLNGEFTLHRVEYDIDAVAQKMEAAGFEEYYFGGLYSGAGKLTRRL
jgi:predicted phosphodiesterase